VSYSLSLSLILYAILSCINKQTNKETDFNFKLTSQDLDNHIYFIFLKLHKISYLNFDFLTLAKDIQHERKKKKKKKKNKKKKKKKKKKTNFIKCMVAC